MRYFYDIGANVGQTFDHYLLPGKFRDCLVFCFEPSPRHLSALREKAVSVASQFQGITIIPAAVGRVPGLARLYEKRTLLSDSVCPEWRENLTTGVMVEVPVVVLSSFLLKHGLSAEVEAKIDVEGAEYDILADLLAHPMSLSRVKSLHVEWHDVGEHTQEEREDLTRKVAAWGVEIKRWPF